MSLYKSSFALQAWRTGHCVFDFFALCEESLDREGVQYIQPLAKRLYTNFTTNIFQLTFFYNKMVFYLHVYNMMTVSVFDKL